MPNFANLSGVKINIYFGEHWPPHIHAEYNDYEELLEIETFAIYEGYLPSKQHKLAVKWLKEHQVESRKIFHELNPHLNAKNRKNTKSAKRKKN